MSNSYYLSEVSKVHSSDDISMRDINDVTYYKNNPLFVKFSSALQIVIYYDDIEVCNPLGSSAGVHKL